MTAFFRRIGFAFKCLFLVLFAGRLPEPIPDEFKPRTVPLGTETRPTSSVPAGAPPQTVTRASGDEGDRAVQVLALLQRDGRLVDFLYEELSSYPDDQVGAAAREVHASCRQVLQRYLVLEPVLDGEEGRPALVEPGVDPGVVKLVGNVTGRPPFRGVLRHRGWKVTRVTLPPPPDGPARSIIAPAEVEIG